MARRKATATSQRTDRFVSASDFHLPPLGVVAFLAVAICVAYLPAMQGGFVWDDERHVTRPELRSLAGLYRIWFDVSATAAEQYYPLLHSAFWLQYHLWGEQALGYHLVNLLLHTGAACLVYAVSRNLQIPGAALAAAIFALHPVQVETVAWITEEKNTLSAVFYLGAMLAYLRFDETRRESWYALGLGLFVLGLLSKTVIATLPGALLVLCWWQRGRLSASRDVLPVIPFFVLGTVAGLFTAGVERYFIGAGGEAFDLTLVQRVLLSGRVIWFYLGKLLWPTNLIFIYPRWDVDPSVAWQWLFPLAAAAVLATLWMTRRRWRAPLAAGLFFVGTLFPVLGYLNLFFFTFSYVADHFQYLASLGMIVPASSALALGVARLPQRRRWAGNGLSVVLVGVLATLTWRQSLMYRDVATLYQTTIDRNPSCWMAYFNLGVTLLDRSTPERAIPYFEQALRLKPNYTEAEGLRFRSDFAVAHYDLGSALMNTGRPQEAIEHLEEALRLKPDYAEAHNNLGNVLLSIGRPQEAIEHFEQALRLKPDYLDARNNLGTAMLDTGRPEEAIGQFQQALRLKPNFVEARNNLGLALLNTGRPQEAIEHFQEALGLKPDYPDAHTGLGIALVETHRPHEAIPHFEQALRLKPGDPSTYVNLAVAQAEINQPSVALAMAQKALELARAQGQGALAQQIEAWLGSYRDSLPPGGKLPAAVEP